MKKFLSLPLCLILTLSLRVSCSDKETVSSPEALVDSITIKGKQYSTSLTELDLLEMDLDDEDIKSLRHMKNLTELSLYGNQIRDLTPLAGLTNLTELTLAYNHISDLTPLAGLTNLIDLDLSDNQISDLTPLAGLMNLTYLGLSDNPITDWSPVAHVDHVDGRP